MVGTVEQRFFFDKKRTETVRRQLAEQTARVSTDEEEERLKAELDLVQRSNLSVKREPDNE